MVTAVITCCKRLHNVKDIYQALKDQTHPCDDIWLFYNGKENLDEHDLPPFGRVVKSSDGEDHYARYAIALAALTEWIFILDDDCIPQPRWIETCMTTEKVVGDGVFTPSGFLVYKPDFATGPYTTIEQVGREEPPRPDRVIEVDMPYHSFLMRRHTLASMFHDPLGVGLRDGERVPIVGHEDVLLACRAWVRLGVGVFVPAAPSADMAGANDEIHEEVHANWATRPKFWDARLASLRFETSLGWKPWICRGNKRQQRQRQQGLAPLQNS